MDKEQIDQPEENQAQRDARAADAQQPRGNPDTDHDSVRKGEEQMDKIVGN
jgi:hypothetical protein